jgi:hypothetical protein
MGLYDRGCCDYKVSRRAVVVLNALIFIFCLIFIGVGATSLVYVKDFQKALSDYCIGQCVYARVDANAPDPVFASNPVGCKCEGDESHTTLPTVVFLTPAIGLIVIGHWTCLASFFGCFGAVKERPVIIYGYLCMLFILVILQLSFGGAAGAVASGDAQQIQGPLNGALRDKYRQLNWESLSLFFPPECYRGSRDVEIAGSGKNVTYKFPLCGFDDQCYTGVGKGQAVSGAVVQNDQTADEKACCAADSTCDRSKAECITASDCLDTFFRRAAGPVATMCFLPIFMEILAMIFACLIRKGPPEGGRESVNANGAMVDMPHPPSTV